MKSKEIFEIQQFGLILRTPGIHSLNYGSHVTKNNGMHQSADQHHQDWEHFLDVSVGRHIAEADAGQTRGGEVEGCDIGRQIGDIVYDVFVAELLR